MIRPSAQTGIEGIVDTGLYTTGNNMTAISIIEATLLHKLESLQK